MVRIVDKRSHHVSLHLRSKVWREQLPSSTAAASGTMANSGSTLDSLIKYKTLVLWNVNSRTEVVSLSGHRESVNALAFSPDGRMLASAGGYMIGGREYIINLWDLSGYHLLARSCASPPEVSASLDGSFKLLPDGSG